jgi:phenylacetic acid degradation operon negative regulatory protein
VKARSALFTVFGDVVRPAGGEAWLSVITGCMATLGVRSQAVRTALHRMTAEGWVEPRRSGRYAAYRLTDRGVARLEEAAARIYRLRSLDWDGRWRLLLAPALTDPDVVAELGWIGYGRVQPGVWAHPHPHPDAAVALLARVGAATTWVEGAGVADDRAFAAAAWSLEDLRRRHEAFLSDWAEVTVPDDPAAMLGLRLRLVHHWRSFLFLDPGLPAEVLPPAWPGYAAAARFAAIYEQVREGSWAHVAELHRRAPGQDDGRGGGGDGGGDGDGDGGMVVSEALSPFARGLAALQHG